MDHASRRDASRHKCLTLSALLHGAPSSTGHSIAVINDLVDRHKTVNVGTQVKATVTTADAVIDPDLHERLHEDNANVYEIIQLKVQIAKVIQDTETGEARLVQQST